MVEEIVRGVLDSFVCGLINEAVSIDDIYTQYYTDIPSDMYYDAVASDPTYNTNKPQKMGKYGKWILSLIRNGQISENDLDKVKGLLKKFEEHKATIVPNDIMRYSSLDQLETSINSIKDKEAISNNQKKHNEAQKVYEDDEWLVIVPLTESASKQYGRGTKWCTCANNNNLFEYYNSFGKLYININKKKGRKYQFHFESGEFKNELNKDIKFTVKDYLNNSVADIVGLSVGLRRYYLDNIEYGVSGLLKSINEKLSDGINKIKDGAPFENSLLTISESDDGKVKIISINGLYNFVNSDTLELVSPKHWFKFCEPFLTVVYNGKEYQISDVELVNGYRYLIDTKGNFYDLDDWEDYQELNPPYGLEN